MSNQGGLSGRVDDAMDSVDSQVEDLVLTLTGEFLERMKATGTSRTELARRLGVKLPRVTRILQGNDNFTLRTVVQVANALDSRLVFTLVPRGISDKMEVPLERPMQTVLSSQTVCEVSRNLREHVEV
ncbi:MAG: helix-turn-helix domain-containing protein [Coriobacteriia bacterium]